MNASNHLWNIACTAAVVSALVMLAARCDAQGAMHDTVLREGAPVSVPPLRGHIRDDPYAFTPVDSEPWSSQDPVSRSVYPPEAVRRGIEGRVYLRFKVLKTGLVGKVLVEKSAHPLLTQAAIDAIRGLTFTPAVRNG